MDLVIPLERYIKKTFYNLKKLHLSHAFQVHIPTSTSAQANLSLLGDISPNHTHFFEVLYVGKIRVSHKRVPYSFIDDALPKFKAYDAQRSRLLQMGTNRKMSFNNDGSFDSIGRCNPVSGSLKEDDNEDEEDTSDDKNISNLNQQKDVENLIIVEDQTAEKSNEESSGIAIVVNNERRKSNKCVTINTDSDVTEENKENKLPTRLIRGLSEIDMQIRRE